MTRLPDRARGCIPRLPMRMELLFRSRAGTSLTSTSRIERARGPLDTRSGSTAVSSVRAFGPCPTFFATVNENRLRSPHYAAAVVLGQQGNGPRRWSDERVEHGTVGGSTACFSEMADRPRGDSRTIVPGICGPRPSRKPFARHAALLPADHGAMAAFLRGAEVERPARGIAGSLDCVRRLATGRREQ